VARAHAIAAVIEDAAHQQSLRSCPGGAIAVVLFRKLSLDAVEQVTIDDRRMLRCDGVRV
jgi:hypothetical protein